jgi:tripartite-type tricarboxylate transporter receptor subunit TctC
MNLTRRSMLRLGAGFVVLPTASLIARAEPYPTRSLRLLVGFPAGSGADTSARIIGQWLSDRLGQPVIVDNRPGAGTNIAAQAAANSPPDGYTLLHISSTSASNVTLYGSLRFNLLTDMAPVAGLARAPLVMVINPSIPAKTVAEFAAYARAHPSKVNMASVGVGTVVHLAGELFKAASGVNMLHVPYRGAPAALTDMIAGNVQVMFCTLPPALPHIRSGAVRALGVTTATWVDVLPDISPIGESIPGYEASIWEGLAAPNGTPREVIERLNREVNAGLKDAAIKAQFGAIGATPMILTDEDFSMFFAAETERWAKIIRAAKISVE